MLRTIRNKNKISQKDLAKKIGITQCHLSKIENYKFSPQIRVLMDISEVLDECVISILIHYCCIPCKSYEKQNCILAQINLNKSKLK